MIRVVIVDDSATMRALIRHVLDRDGDIEVVGEAADALEAREAIKRLSPDVLTLDVEMPRMNGLEFLEKIIRLRPMPVVMISTLTAQGATATLEALELGAVDCVAKPSGGEADAFAGLADKIRHAATARVRSRRSPPRAVPTAESLYRSNGDVIAIGASTGGVEALLTVLSSFPRNCSPTLITQHMPAQFTRSFAERLNSRCLPLVHEAQEGMPLREGEVYVAPGGRHLEAAGSVLSPYCRITEGPTISGHRPSVDVLFRSVSRVFGRRSVGLILTGMGRDGAEGLLAMRRGGARTFGQDEASCVVYGMPKAAEEIGAVERTAPIDRLAHLILSQTSRHAAAPLLKVL